MAEEAETTIQQLKIAKKSYKSQITKFKNYFQKELTSETPNIIQIELRLSKIEPILEQFYEIQSQIELLDKTDTEAALEEERTEFENTYFDIVANSKAFLNNIKRQDDNVSLSGSDIAASSARHSSNSVASITRQQIKLPPINLPTFDGNFENWLFFRDSFQSIIHDDSSIVDINKFHYLRLSLKGQAADLLKSLELSANNYQVAWNLLIERYENKPLLKKNHIKALFDFKPVTKECPLELRNILDGMRRHLRALEVLGEPVKSWDSLIIHLFTSKLDPVTRREWEGEYAKHDNATFDIFSKFLADKCRMLETIIPQKSKTNVRGFFSANTLSCNFCNKDHTIYNCNRFLDLNAKDRLTEVNRLKLCVNCLRNNHSTSQCRSMHCRKCNNKHNTLLHFSYQNNNTSNNNRTNNNHFQRRNEPQTQSSVNSNVANLNINSDNQLNTNSENQQNINSYNQQNTNSQNQQSTSSLISSHFSPNNVLLSTALVYISDNHNNTHLCRILLDSGSESNFISENLCKKLNLKTSTINCSVTGIGQNCTNIIKYTNVTVHARSVAFKINLKCLVLPQITGKVPAVSVDINHLQIPPNLILADPSYNEPGPIDLLLGANNFWELIMIGQIKLGKNLPTLQKTQFGWIVSGSVLPPQTKQTHNSTVSCYLSTLDSQSSDLNLSKFWEMEETNYVKPLSPDDSFCEELFQNTTIQNPDGRFVVKLPLKYPVSSLGDSKELATKCFMNLEKRLQANPELNSEYSDFLFEYESLGHMTEVKPFELEGKICYFLPHHCVLKPSSNTTKLRVVFNGSAVTKSGLSLNNILRVGPTVQEELFSIILRTRKHNIMITADIAKMYRQILVDQDQRSLQLILWRSNPESDIKIYQLNTLTYGTAPAAFLATRCLKEISIQCEKSDPEISKIIRNDFYVDDLCTGCSSVEDAKYIKQRISEILNSAGFPLRKFMSNCVDILSDSFENSSTMLHFGEPHENKTLGLLWDSQADVFKYSIKDLNDTAPTKRKILSCISQIFDPLGLVQPVIIIAKVIIQKLWQYKLNWDESVPTEIFSTWSKFQIQIQDLNNLKIPRHFLPDKPVSIQLHGFSDASEMAYGACLYIRAIDSDGTCHCHLICAKTRVAPLKTVTIPRLELCGALLLAELYSKVTASLDLPVNKSFFWCDSTIALAWIKSSPHQWNIFVANRINQIQSLTDPESWRYVNTQENPADILTRGISPTAIINNQLWWKGPKWLLYAQNQWPTEINNTFDTNVSEIPEMRTVKPISLTSTVDNSFDLFNRYSSLSKLQRVVSYCFRFINNCRKPKKLRKTESLDVEELQFSLYKLIQLVQRQEFSKEYHDLLNSRSVDSKSKILKLNPYLDVNGTIRVGGRLKHSSFNFEKKHPAILPGRHILAKLIATQEHLRLLHAGPQLLLASIRERFWPTSGRSLVKQVVRQCIRCFRFNATPTTYLMGNLPECRVTPQRPFYNVGVDFCGPFLIKDRLTRNYKVMKVYVCLFVCLATKAIHLELVNSLSTEAFLSTLRRFFSRRGLSSNIYSDHGTNFVGAKNELDKFLSKHNEHEIQSSLSQDNVKWHFIPPHSPHFGGIWEAGVKSTKFHLKRTLSQVPLCYEDFLTVLNQVEACLNSRPLFPSSNDPNDPQPITPAHFLIGERLTSIPDHDYTDIQENRLSRFQRLQKITQSFWKRWSKEFISELQQRTKWKKRCPELLKPGKLVLIKEDGLPPLKWKIGVIEAVHPGSDGIVRAATVRIGSSTLKRPATKLCTLPDCESC